MNKEEVSRNFRGRWIHISKVTDPVVYNLNVFLGLFLIEATGLFSHFHNYFSHCAAEFFVKTWMNFIKGTTW
jgi:hypothetical protein